MVILRTTLGYGLHCMDLRVDTDLTLKEDTRYAVKIAGKTVEQHKDETTAIERAAVMLRAGESANPTYEGYREALRKVGVDYRK